MQKQAELARLQGDNTRAQLLQQELESARELAELEELRQLAIASGNQQLILDLNQAIALQEQISRLQIQNIRDAQQQQATPNVPATNNQSSSGNNSTASAAANLFFLYIAAYSLAFGDI